MWFTPRSASIALTCLDEVLSWCRLFNSNFLFDSDIYLDVLGARGLLKGRALAVMDETATCYTMPLLASIKCLLAVV